MRTILTIIVAFCAAGMLINAQAQKKQTTFGTPPDKNSKPIALAEAVAARSFNAPLVVTARVWEVCQETGCWMILHDKDAKVRVSFKDYGFFVPKKLAGRIVVIQGVLSETVVTEADARHYAEDAGMSKEEIEQIKGDRRELAFEATGVRIVK